VLCYKRVKVLSGGLASPLLFKGQRRIAALTDPWKKGSAVMTNPFLQPGSLLAEQERRRREKFKVGVYAVLITAAVFLAGLLIQGCIHVQSS
jgi:hypothetical protein